MISAYTGQDVREGGNKISRAFMSFGSRMPSESELAMARFQGRHVATIAGKLAGK